MITSRLPLRGIAVFEAVARLGSLKAAAMELNLTPSAVSHQIRSLELELGVELFERASRGIRLTSQAAEYAKILHVLIGRIRLLAGRRTARRRLRFVLRSGRHGETRECKRRRQPDHKRCE